MRGALLGWLAVACSWGCGVRAADSSSAQATASQKHAVVVVELFTSEGCSSCPPADDVLADLIRNQPLPNVTIVGLGEHVDYWDNLGWRDVFSAPTFTARQSDYDHDVFHTGSIYTPQAVVDGRFQMVGSDSAALRRAILNAAKAPKALVNLSATASGRSTVTARIDVDLPQELPLTDSLDVVAAIVERNLATKVQRGENGGHLLKHGVVARSLVAAGAMKRSERTFSKLLTLQIDPLWKQPDIQIAVFVQNRTRKAIVGAAIEPLRPSSVER